MTPTPPSLSTRRAWVTLATEPEYLPGALGLARSLRRSRSEYPLIVMVTHPQYPSMVDALRSEGCEVREVEPILHGDSSFAAARYAAVWAKLRVWEFEDLDRAVFLDDDMLVLRNMDELFDMELPPEGIAASPACRCNPHHRSTYPKDWIPENCYYTHVKQASQPAVAGGQDYFNAGLLVLQPDRRDFAAFLRRLALPDAPPLPFADQDLLNEHFRARWKILPYTFNALKTLRYCHPSLWNIADVRNLHFILDKPWDAGSADDSLYGDLNALWREIYDEGTPNNLHKR